MSTMMRNEENGEQSVLPEELKGLLNKMEPGLPIPDLVSYYVLEKDRKVFLENDVDSSVMNIERLILRWNMEDAGKPADERRPILLYISSPGGDVDMMWSLIDMIEASETPVYTVNMALAASAAGLIFLAGRKRFMLKRSRVVIHEGSARMSGDAVKVMDAGDTYRRMLKRMKDYILERTAIGSQLLNRQKCHDWDLDSAFCLKYGACDRVVEKLNEIL